MFMCSILLFVNPSLLSVIEENFGLVLLLSGDKTGPSQSSFTENNSIQAY